MKRYIKSSSDNSVVQTVKELLEKYDIITGYIDAVNDDDFGWELDGPRAFADEVFDRMVADGEEIRNLLITTFDVNESTLPSAEEFTKAIDELYDWIIEEAAY